MHVHRGGAMPNLPPRQLITFCASRHVPPTAFVSAVIVRPCGGTQSNVLMKPTLLVFTTTIWYLPDFGERYRIVVLASSDAASAAAGTTKAAIAVTVRMNLRA